MTSFASILSPQVYEDVLSPTKEPQLYICDDWIQPLEVMPKPGELRAKDTARARVAKNCLLVTLMSLNVGYGSLVENYQKEGNPDPPELNPVTLTDEEVRTYRDELDKRRLTEVSVNNSEIAVVKELILRCTMSCLLSRPF